MNSYLLKVFPIVWTQTLSKAFVKFSLGVPIFESDSDFALRENLDQCIHGSKNLKLIKLLPCKVECQFYGEIGATIIKHYHSVEQTITSEIGTLNGCSEPGCFSDNITYASTSEQIDAVIFLAKDCTQEIIFKCSYNQLTGYSWWIGRDGIGNTYWHGNSSQGEGCACFDDDSCGR